MNSDLEVINSLLEELDDALDNGIWFFGFNFTVVKKDTVADILNEIYAEIDKMLAQTIKSRKR